MFKCAARTDSLPEQSPFISFLLCSETLYKVSVLFVSSSSLPLRVLGKALKFLRYISWIYVTKSTHDIVGLGKVASQSAENTSLVSLVLYRNTDNLASNCVTCMLLHLIILEKLTITWHWLLSKYHKQNRKYRNTTHHLILVGFLFCKLKAQQPYSCPDWLLQLLGPLSGGSVGRSQGLGAKTCK